MKQYLVFNYHQSRGLFVRGLFVRGLFEDFCYRYKETKMRQVTKQIKKLVNTESRPCDLSLPQNQQNVGTSNDARRGEFRENARGPCLLIFFEALGEVNDSNELYFLHIEIFFVKQHQNFILCPGFRKTQRCHRS